MRLSFFVPVKTVSEANAHEHWRKRQKRAKEQRSTTQLVASSTARAALIPLPLVVTLTRVSKGTLDDDNLQSALKHVRDGIADWLLVNDRRSDLVKYEYAQERGKEVGVRVEVRRMQEARTA